MASHFPVSNPTSDDDALNAETSFSVKNIVIVRAIESLATTDTTGDPEIELRRAARDASACAELLQYVSQGFPSDRYSLPNILHLYWKYVTTSTVRRT